MAKDFNEYAMNALNEFAAERYAVKHREKADMQTQEAIPMEQGSGEVFARFASGLFKQPKHGIDSRDLKPPAKVQSAPSRGYPRLL